MFPSLIELKKYSKKDMSNLQEFRMVLLGDCATQHLAQAIRGYGYVNKLKISLLDTDYDQIIAQVMDLTSELYQYHADATILCMCVEKLYERYCKTAVELRNQFGKTEYEKIAQIWETLRRNQSGKILQFNFPEADDRCFGNFGNKMNISFIRQLRELNLLLMDGAAQHKDTYIIDISFLQNLYGRKTLHDEKLYYVAKMPFSMEVLPAIAHEIVTVASVFRSRFAKCIVLDLDNTLWGGVIGDDGLEGIQIGELGLGHAFYSFQLWLKELSRRGIVLAVCSKNDEEKAKEPFLKHPEMVLRLDDIAMFVANWEDKASNIRKIQKTLNLGMDSFVFLDDNPFERNLVKSMIPEITVPELPEDPAEYVTFLQEQNLFETINFSEADAERTRQYREEAQRISMQENYLSYEEYLNNLKMEGMAKAFDKFHIPRIAQLTQRSNQFNLRTIRYSEEQIAEIASNSDYLTLYFTLRDQFGDHGLVSVVIMKREENNYFVDTWLMSCRVLKRGMEEFVMNCMVLEAGKQGAECLIGEYKKTSKNAMVEHLYEEMGFETMPDERFRLRLKDYVPKQVSILRVES